MTRDAKETVAFALVILALIGVAVFDYTDVFLLACGAIIVGVPVIGAVLGLNRRS